ncbi:hypothetical protein NDU88_001570 [Pleurodeles waltl]|uniref:Uncharacterized protein n=1 Tax=Pleurodeles waltl TaxID=8319 RepID=A0AAV7KYY7_PLEWA|nr:hypothetical protein NDU88_001570 [Pleurodeles waltl]
MEKDKGGRQSPANNFVKYMQATHDRDKRGTKSLDDSPSATEGYDPKQLSMSDILKEVRGHVYGAGHQDRHRSSGYYTTEDRPLQGGGQGGSGRR